MKADLINPFVEAVNDMMETMMGVLPERLPLELKTEEHTAGDVSGIIGFADKNITGVVALSFPEETALRVYELMTSESVYSIDSAVQDTVGELANMVAGGAKRIFADRGLHFHISIPSVVVGKRHSIFHKLGTPVVIVPFRLEGKPFNMEVSMKVDEK